MVQELIAAGHAVIGLARSDAEAKALTVAGARAHRGALDNPASLRAAAAAADGVIHLAFIHGLLGMTLGQRFGVLAGGMPGGIVSRFMAVSARAERAAIDALGSGWRALADRWS